MATEEEKEEPKVEDTTPETDNGNQTAGSKESDRNPAELDKKRQRKELRKSERADEVSQAKEEIQKLKDKDPETVDKFAAGVAQGFRGNFGGGGSPAPEEPQGQQTAGNGTVPVQGIQGGGYSSPEQEPAGNPNAGLQTQEQEQLADIQPDQFAEPEPAPQSDGQEPAQDPTLTQRVNEDYNAVAAGVGPTDSASVKETEKSAVESAQKTEQERKTFTDPAQELNNRLNADKESALQDVAAAREKYGVTNVQEKIDGKLKEAEAQKGSPLTARERRKITREAEREQEASLDKIYKELNPNYKSAKDFRREQNIKTIIGAIGKLGTMAGQTVTAANSGIILPTKSFSDGIMEDVRISNKEREQLLRAYDEIRQAKINEPLARLQEIEKQQKDLVTSPAAYQTGKTTQADKTTSGTEKTVEKKKEKIDYKDWIESQGGAKGLFGKLQNGEYIIPDIYRNGMPSGAHKVTVDVFNNATGNLFDIFKTLPGVKTDANGQVEDENGNIWVDLHQLQEDIAGAEDAGSREKLQQRYVEYLDKMLKFMEKSESKEAKDALKAYSNLLKGASLDYRAYGESAGEQQGSNENDDVMSLIL